MIGTGFVGPHHVDAVRRAGYATVDVLVGSDPDRTARRASEIGVERWSADVDAVIGDPGIDVVHVCPGSTPVALAVPCSPPGSTSSSKSRSPPT